MSEVTKPILLDETGQSIVTKLDAIKDAITNKLPAGDPVRITVVTPPTTTEYVIGETVDLTGMVVSAIFSNNALIDITDQCTFSPAQGAIAAGDKITASWTWLPTGQTFTATTPIEVEYVTWASGTDAQIKAMVDAHYAGYIDLHDYWAVGDSRSVTLSAVTGDHSLDIDYGIDFGGEDVKLVLWNEGGKELSTPINNISECAFVVGLEKCLDFGSGYGGYDLWDEDHNTNVGGFKATPRRTWLNTTYRDSFPSTLKQVFKQHKNVAGDGDTDVAIVSEDYFALPSLVELYGSVTYNGYDYASAVVESQNSQFEYFETVSNILTLLRNNAGADIWTRSPSTKPNDPLYFCYIANTNQDIKVSYHNSYMPFNLAPFGVI